METRPGVVIVALVITTLARTWPEHFTHLVTIFTGCLGVVIEEFGSYWRNQQRSRYFGFRWSFMPKPHQEQKKALIATFEYVKQLVQMGQEPIYSLSQYRHIRILENELQARPGVKHAPDSGATDPAWLEITRLHKRQAPSLPEELTPWVNQSHNPEKPPTLKKSVMVTMPGSEVAVMVQRGTAKRENVLKTPNKQRLFDVRVFAKDDPNLDRVFKEYLHKKWLPWSLEEKPRRETIRIYEQLFSVFQIMMAGEAETPIELVWGIGHAVWKPPESPRTINHPLLEVLVEIDLDTTSQALRIHPRSALPRIYTAPFEALQLPGIQTLKEDVDRQLQQMDDVERTVNPWDRTSFEGILRSAAAQLAKDARYIPDETDDVTDRTVPRAGESLVITDTWAIYARSRGLNYLVRDLERFQEKVDMGVGDCAILKFATEPSSEQPVRGIWGSDGEIAPVSAGGVVGNMDVDNHGNDNPIYFPKPFNDAQKGILERLDKAEGVVVQGPPGTGKTHTIANIICHYLATGRRVLVTAKSETALDVLKAQIPKEIQPLVISMVSNDREGMQQQKQAIETLQGKVVSLQGRERQILNEIRRGEREVALLQRAIHKIDGQVKHFATQQLQPVVLEWLADNFENAAELAEWVVQHKEHFDWFPDDLGPGDEYTPQFSDEDIAELLIAKQKVGPDINYLNLSLPVINDLPSTGDIAGLHHELIMAKELDAETLRHDIPRFKEEDAETVQIAEGLVKEIHSVLEWVRHNDAGWVGLFLQTRVYADQAAPFWLGLVNELRPELAEVIAEYKHFLRKPVGYKVNDAKERDLLKTAAERGRDGKTPLSFIQRLNPMAREILDSVDVLGRKPQSNDDWGHVAGYLSFEEKCDELIVRWNAIASDAPLPEIPADNAIRAFESVTRQMDEAELQATKLVKTIWWGLDKVFASPTFSGLEPKVEALESAVKALEQNLAMFRLSASTGLKARAVELLGKYDCPEALALLKILAEVGTKDKDVKGLGASWRSQMLRIRQLRGLESSFNTIRKITERIRRSGASVWADNLSQRVHTAEEKEHLIRWQEAWRWARLNTLLRQRDIQGELIGLERKRQEKEDRVKQVFENVVKLRTYLTLCSKMSDRAKSGLAKFSVAIMQVGKGTGGVRAPVFMRIAQRAMAECAEAIPCWIMPGWRVSEVLPTHYGFFDLVIVDEASQCDVRDLPAVARGKKILIVGDDRQVSPTPPFIENKKLFQLKHNYLKDHPFGDLMIPGISLYDLAGAVFPGSKIILNEHFRCVEPIIRFSFGFYPDVAIHPLRIPKATERIDPPLVDILVENGEKVRNVNHHEAMVVVDEIERLVADNRYGSRSIGVISLIGRKQAALIQARLLERIGQEQFIKHRIVCGDSASFQGREKDIVFLSMVASPGQSRAFTMRQTEQRFNVAASRARDRLYLVRSVTLEALPNPRDLKVKLIHHFKDPMPVHAPVDRELVGLCESGFERDVFLWLTRKGYFVMPQVSVGEYRIDLVVEGDNDRRLAIELDGDRYHGPERWLEDWTRQKVLERAGWRFWRCWASSYTADPEGCLNSLTQILEEMGIHPSGQKAKKYAYTEHRRVEAKWEPGEAELEFEEGDAVEVGDSVVIGLEDRSQGYLTVLITKDRSEPDNLVFMPDHPAAKALLNKMVGDELKIDILGKRQKVSLVRIAKGGVKSKQGPTQLQLPIPSPSANPPPTKPPPTGAVSDDYPDPRNADRGQVERYLNMLVAEHGPMVVEHLYYVYRERVGVKKLGKQIKQGLDSGLAALLKSGKVQVVGKPSTKTAIDMYMVVKTPEQDDVAIRGDIGRRIEWIPLNELRAVAGKIKATRPFLGREELMRGILKQYGLKRLTKKTRYILSNALADEGGNAQ